MSSLPRLAALAWLLATAPLLRGDTLDNGIELPTVWPPKVTGFSDEPMAVPYLSNPPAVIPIKQGRQLFVDDFLIESTTLNRQFHQPKFHPASPVLKPEKEWEQNQEGGWAAPYSDGVWYDSRQGKFLMWYRAADRRTCLAESTDGIHWTRPELALEPGTNTVLRTVRDSTTVWLDPGAPAAERFKLFEARYKKRAWEIALHTSADGRTWTDELAVSGPSWDRSTVFFNPFRNVWVASVRGHDQIKPAPVHRLRCYFEGQAATGVLGWKQHCDEVAKGNLLPHDLQPWLGADRLDPQHPDPRFHDQKPQLYNLDAFPYESLMIGLLTIWQGPQNEECAKYGIQKRNEVLVGFSRDGFHWHRPSRVPLLGVSSDPAAWNAGNVQSAGGGCVVVGDELYFYCSGRSMASPSQCSTGLATLRRDGFASMDAREGGGTLTTRPLQLTGEQLFVNASPGSGTLRVELLDSSGKELPGYSADECRPIAGDQPRARVLWKGERTLKSAPQPLRIRFVLSSGSLWSFWTTSDLGGASHGYVAAGGPAFDGLRDEPK